MRRIKNIIIDKWSDLIAYLVKTELFREDYNQRECADKYRLIRAIHRGVIKFIVLVIIVCSLAAWILSWPPEKGDNAGHYKYINSSNTLTETVNRIVIAEHNDEADCETCAPESPQESQEDLNKFNKEKRDINAQEGMWRAANALVALTVLQVFIGALTAIFLIKTFRTQRGELNQAKRAADTAEQAHRAHVFLDAKVDFVDFVMSDDPIDNRREVDIRACIRNFGTTPARAVEYEFTWNNLNRPPNDGQVTDSGVIGFLDAGESHHILNIRESTASFFDIGDWKGAEAMRLNLTGSIAYIDIYGIKRGPVTITGDVEFKLRHNNNFEPLVGGLAELTNKGGIVVLVNYLLDNIKSVRFSTTQDPDGDKN